MDPGQYGLTRSSASHLLRSGSHYRTGGPHYLMNKRVYFGDESEMNEAA